MAGHPYPDHHQYELQDLLFADEAPVILTEKDATKVSHLRLHHAWMLRVKAVIEPGLFKAVEQRLFELHPHLPYQRALPASKPKAPTASKTRQSPAKKR